MVEALYVRGVAIYPGLLDRTEQERLVAEVRTVVRAAPLFHPVTSRGQQMSVRMTSAGSLGWVSDRRGYRYEPRHPSGVPWPQIPKAALKVWSAVSSSKAAPDCCLVNFYGADARMGLHQDRDEVDFDQPVVSISLGDSALFRIGNQERGGKTESLWLNSGDVLVMGGQARLLYHGVDRVKAGTSTLLKDSGRLNLTLRVAGQT